MRGLKRVMRARRGRLGMTLIEIMISLVLLGIVSGVIMRVVVRQQRFYQGVNSIMSQRGQLRQATSILPVDLRSVSSVGADILVASDSSIEFMVNVGTSIVCEVPAGGSTLVIPFDTLWSGQVLTTWYGNGLPTAGTTVYVYNDSSVAGNEEDRWQKFKMTGIAQDASKCLTSFHTVNDAGKKRSVITLTSTEPNDVSTGGPISRYINVGAPMRFMKRVRYKLFQHSDNKWYLGFSPYDPATNTYDALSPVSGPYDAYANTGSGVGFRYYTVDGVEVASGADSVTRLSIARVDLIARARTSENVRSAGVQNGVQQQYRDSLAVSVMLRNRN